MLSKQLVHLNMAGGIQAKDDERLVIPSKLAVADNVQFDDASTVVRRGGQSRVSLTPISPYSVFQIGRATRAFTHQGTALVEHDGVPSPGVLQGGLSRVSPAGGTTPVFNVSNPATHVAPFNFKRASALTKRIGSVEPKGSSYGTGIPLADGSYDCATTGSLTCYVWESRDVPTGAQAVRVRIVDELSGFAQLDSTITDPAKVLSKPRVIISEGMFHVYFGSFTSGSNQFEVKHIGFPVAGGVTAITSVTPLTNTPGTCEAVVGSEVLFDVDYSEKISKLGLVVRGNATSVLARFLDPADGVTVVSSNTGTSTVRMTSLAAILDPDSKSLVYAYSIGTNLLKANSYDGATFLGEATVGTGAGGSVAGRVTLFAEDVGGGRISGAFDTLTNLGVSSVLRLTVFDNTLAVLGECAGGPADARWCVGGRIAQSKNARLYLPLVFISSQFQHTLYVIDLSSQLQNIGVAGATAPSPFVLARIDYGEVAVDLNRWDTPTRVPTMAQLALGDIFIIPYLKYEMNLRLAGSGSNSNATFYCLASATIDMDSQLGFQEINGLTYVAGGCPMMYDGVNYTEESFHHAPEVVLPGTLGATGRYGLPNVSGSYTVCFTVAWQDAQGNWHESGVSNQFTYTVIGGSGNYQFTPTLLLPPSQKANVRVLMYRTVAGTDTTFYLASLLNGSNVSEGTSPDTAASGEALYTTGGVLPNEPMPACRHISLFQKRLVASGCGDGSRVFWSKQSTPGYGVEFCSSDPTHGTTVPADYGRVVATEEMDDRLIILCENAVGGVFGTGPSPTGTQGQYSDFNTLITETGAQWDSLRSVVRGPEGVWFRSPYGIRLASRSGGLARSQDGKQAGADVDPLVSGSVVAVAGDAKQQIRFFTSAGNCLVWDYQWQQWTRFTGMSNVDAVFANDRYYHLNNADGAAMLRYTNESVTLDVNDVGAAAQEFNSYIETPWLSFAGIQGFQRLYRLTVVGRNVDSSVQQATFAGAVGYNFNPTSPPSEETFPVAITPATGGVVQFQHHFAQQKCEAVKIGLSFRPTGTNSGRFRLTDLTLQVGVKQGYYRLPSSQRF